MPLDPPACTLARDDWSMAPPASPPRSRSRPPPASLLPRYETGRAQFPPDLFQGNRPFFPLPPPPLSHRSRVGQRLQPQRSQHLLLPPATPAGPPAAPPRAASPSTLAQIRAADGPAPTADPPTPHPLPPVNLPRAPSLPPPPARPDGSDPLHSFPATNNLGEVLLGVRPGWSGAPSFFPA